MMARTGRDGHALPGQQRNLLTIGFHHGRPGQNEEELLGVPVERTYPGGAGRHALLNAQAPLPR